MPYNIGDKVRIVNYGHPIWINKLADEYHFNDEGLSSLPTIDEDEQFKWKDLRPELVGVEGIVTGLSSDKKQYSLDTNRGAMAWFGEGQLELIAANPNKL